MLQTLTYSSRSIHLNKTTHKHEEIFMSKCQYDLAVVVQKVLDDLFQFKLSFSKKASTEW